MATIVTKDVHTKEDADGNITIDTVEKTFKKDVEPDYIKIYTKMWCEFNEIPDQWRLLFLELVQRMSYCNATALNDSQIVWTGDPIASSIMKTLGWTSKRMYQKGLAELVKHKAIKRVARGVYQINPNYAGKGGWRYDPRLKQGGIKDLVATFDYVNKTVDAKIIWADDGTDDEINKIMRAGIGAKDTNNTVLKTTKISNSDEQEAS